MATLTVELDSKAPRDAEELADAAAQLVEQRIGRLGLVRLIYTDQCGMEEHRWIAEQRLLPNMSSQVRRNRRDAQRKELADSAGITLPGCGARDALILINARQPERELGATVVHELVHGVQLADHRYRAEHLRYLAHAVGIEDIGRVAYWRHMRAMDRAEREAERAEHLARHLTR